jgi:hypothetical protein
VENDPTEEARRCLNVALNVPSANAALHLSQRGNLHSTSKV